MAISPKHEEKIEAFEAELKIAGDRLPVEAIAKRGSILGSKKLEDGLRAAIYMERIHQKALNAAWDELIPVDALMETFRGEL